MSVGRECGGWGGGGGVVGGGGVFFNDTATTEIYTLSLHDALPIWEGNRLSGQNVFVNGAGGGVGALALQIAKAYGAHVTAVDTTTKLGMLGTLGSDEVIDYTQEDFTQNGKQYDLIFDAAAFRDALSCSLELLGAEPLEQGEDEHGHPAFRFPPLDRRAVTDASWAATLDTLRVPRKTGQKLAEWRREAPIRPVVFEDAGVDLDRPIVTSCGSGVTACVLALGLELAGCRDYTVYDGSWTEWGGRVDLPIEP